MPSAFRELPRRIALCLGHLGFSPAAVLLGTESCEPETLHIMTRFWVLMLHLAFKEFRQHLLVGLFCMLTDGFAPHGKDRTGLITNRNRRFAITEKILEVLSRGLGSFPACEFQVDPQPLPPAWVVPPRNAIPEIKEFQLTLSAKGSDLALLCGERSIHHLLGVHARVVKGFALREDGNLLELIVMLTDVVKVCLSFAAVVVQLLILEVNRGGVLRPAFGVNLAVGFNVLEPRQLLIVVRYNELDAWR